jgi:hypothetical protein
VIYECDQTGVVEPQKQKATAISRLKCNGPSQWCGFGFLYVSSKIFTQCAKDSGVML